MGRSTVHYADNETNNILKRLHNKLRPAGTPVERVEYIIELLLLRIFEAKLKQDGTFAPLRRLFEGENYRLLFSHLLSLTGDQVLSELNKNIFPFYASILTKARQVISGNMPTKMQDQLVLMEEVFANSNFTNNVKGGVIAEVIGLVNEIDEQWVLKTDLLGDAIESALSETGGTKDLGLYRTPDHIRKMMVEMVDPDFTDTIFDPACGTSGFLFNAYEYVIEKARKTRRFPPEHIANQFYRVGIGGIEYQGRIRKMAAVNMYIRGLNPHNIAQGDSLKMYDPLSDAGSKSVVIANPPFGAERDQPAYPNVWEEYSKESETTILFVKLMFDLLKQGGRCAVVVSEGFLTWGQNSACALRKRLLNEANLRAIISLPQGVFVSKGGQGAKTSILYFEKGSSTDPSLQPAGTSFVWYYKIENDGFSMGTNRKPIEGSQIPQLVEIFKEIKQGKKPKDTKHSFCIPKEWIGTLDPRVAERIKKEVKERFTEKNKAKREKLLAGLDEKFVKGKLSREMYDEKLWQFDNVVESQIDNEIAKAIEKANSYHFNLQNYRSNLSEEQIKEWHAVCHSFTICHSEQIQHSEQTPHSEQIPHGHSERSEESQVSSIEKRYQELKTTDPKTALQTLASFDPQNALQIDITREYLSKVERQVLEKDKNLKKLEIILKKGFHYPIVSLTELIVVNGEKIKPAEYPEKEFTVLGVSNQTGVFINEKLKGEDIKQAYFKVRKNQFCYNPYRINVGSIGLCEFGFENQIISGAYNVFGCKESELNPKYLEPLFKTKRFLDYVNEKASGGVRMDFKIEYLQEWEIPLPPLEVQNEIVEKIERQKQIIEGAERIICNFENDCLSSSGSKFIFGQCIVDLQNGLYKNTESYGSGFNIVRINDYKNGDTIEDLSGLEKLELTDNEKQKYSVEKNDLLINRVNSLEHVGKVAIIGNIQETLVYESNMIRTRVNSDILLPKYALYILASVDIKKQLQKKSKRAINQVSINQDDLKSVEVVLPPLETQCQIVEKLDHQMQALEGVRLLKAEAQKRIEEVLAKVWGEE